MENVFNKLCHTRLTFLWQCQKILTRECPEESLKAISYSTLSQSCVNLTNGPLEISLKVSSDISCTVCDISSMSTRRPSAEALDTAEACMTSTEFACRGSSISDNDRLTTHTPQNFRSPGVAILICLLWIFEAGLQKRYSAGQGFFLMPARRKRCERRTSVTAEVFVLQSSHKFVCHHQPCHQGQLRCRGSALYLFRSTSYLHSYLCFNPIIFLHQDGDLGLNQRPQAGPRIRGFRPFDRARCHILPLRSSHSRSYSASSSCWLEPRYS